MNGAAARLSHHLPTWTRGRGLAVCARRRFGIVADLDMVYTDQWGVAELRERFPHWASDPVAPVSIAQNPARLEEIADRSVDFVVAFELCGAPDTIGQAFAAVARVLAPGGCLILLQREEGQPVLEHREAALARVFSHQAIYAEHFRFELAAAIGQCETATVFERKWPELADGELVSHGHAVYLVDEGRLRHVQSPAVLALIQQPDQPISPLAARHAEKLPIGKGLSETMALALVKARRERARH